MRLIIQNDEDDVAAWMSTYIMNRINEFKPSKKRPFVLGLSTGASLTRIYRKLVALHRKGQLSFEHVVTFNSDEYCGLHESHPQSYRKFMWDNLFKHVDIMRENVHIMDGCAANPLEECAKFEHKINEYDGIELFLGGIGADGHLAFNEPGSSLTSRTRVKTLAYDTIAANARSFGGSMDQVPKTAMTVGVGTIMDSREVCVIITGITKSYALAQVVEEGVNHMVTVSMLQMHKRACIVCDEDATMELKVKTVKYFNGLRQTHNKLVKKRKFSENENENG
jgi:glucosamine-6-phosphate deaminase